VGDVDGNLGPRLPPRVGDLAPRRIGLRAAVSFVVLAAVTSVALHAHAGDARETCRRTQLDAASKLYERRYACWTKGFKSLAFDLSACLGKAEDRFLASYASAAAKAAKAGFECGLRMPVESLLSVAAGDVDPVVGAIAGNVDLANTTDRKLRASRMGAVGTYAARAFNAEMGFAKDGDAARLGRRLDDARLKLEKSFASALSSGAKHGIAYDGVAADPIADSLAAAASLWERMTRATNGAFTVAGTIFAAESTFVDSDVNDTSTMPAPNDINILAQALPVPATVGGYVNVAGFGPAGDSFSAGDTHDLYLASLRAGQVVVLVLGDVPDPNDPNRVDLDLKLSGQAIPAPIYSEGTGSIELIVAPADGTYFIDVYPYALCHCGGTYTLSIGQTVPAAAARAERTDVEFVPGQLIVKLRQPGDANASAGVSALRHPAPVLPKELGLEKLAGDASREMLVQLPPPGPAKTATFQALGAASAQQRLAAQSPSADDLARRETVLALKELRKRPEIESVELNTIMRPSVVPADPYYTLQWNYPLIHLPQAWDIVTGDPNVVVAVVDTGVRLDHPDLQGQLVPGYDFVSDAARARDGDGIDPDPNDPGDRGAGTGASSFHGTHVAGTVAAATNNGIGVAGVAWGARVMPVRVLGVNGGTQYDVMQGVRYAAGLENDSGTLPPKPVDVINLSLGGGGFSQTAQDVFTAARAAGVIVVAAAGNDSTSAPSFPASYAGVVSVAAVDLNRNPAWYSNFGPLVDIAAPGGDTSADRNADGYADGVLSTLADDSVSPTVFVYAFYQGTSMATPHVSGVFALMRSVDPTISPATIDTLLSQGKLTEDIGAPGRDDRTGWGLIDARAAVIAAGAPDTGPGVSLSVTPSGLNFGLSLDTIDFNVANAGSDPLTVTSVTVVDAGSVPWLSLAPASVDGAGLGTYRATVDRTSLTQTPKSYAATIDVVSSGGTVHVPVVMRVGGATTSDAGFHYILLVDAQSLEPIDEIATGATDGVYPYSFSNVPQGDYLVIAGTDMDDDKLICDGGEACGSYPTLDLPAPLTVDHDISNADFGTAFRQSIGSGASAANPASGLVRRHR